MRSSIDTDCSLDLHEAEQLLEMMFYTFENADDREEWFKMRAPIGSSIYAVIRIVQAATRRVEGRSAVMERRTH